MEWLKIVHGHEKAKSLATFRPGDEVRVWYKILETEGKERLGQFEGTVLRLRGAGHSRTFTVRRVTFGEGVERVFPLDSKNIARVEVLRQGRVKRSRLYFLRDVIGKTRIALAEPAGASTAAAGKPSQETTPSHASAAAEKIAGEKPAAARGAKPAIAGTASS